MTMITPSYLGETIEYSSLHACRSTLEDPTGISIFLALAAGLPQISFAAVPTWGTTADDRASLLKHANVTLRAPTDDTDAIYSEARVLLVPSLWDEAFGKVVIEAMIRGIPVIASMVGGLPEAKLGIDYILPVSPITQYFRRLDECLVPLPVVPPQDISPWLSALGALIKDQDQCNRLGRASRSAALNYISESGPERFEQFLRGLDSSI